MASNPASGAHPRHDNIPGAKIGVMLVNLGTPDAPNVHSVKRYLAEFLSDRRVIEMHPWLWKPLLHSVILPMRGKRVAESYGKIWHHDTDESPLRYFTRRQSELLGERMSQMQPEIIVDWAMRYGSPSIPGALDDLRERGCRRILVVPLYPQYSATTTATVVDQVFESLRNMRFQPALRTLPPYYDHEIYIETLASTVKKDLENLTEKPEVVIASFHGLPRAYIEAGDPYYCHCAKTARLLREKLGFEEKEFRMTFQSRFGPKQWLQPYTDHSLIELANAGVRRVAVVTPGFAADCLETLEEIGMQNRDLFFSHGGECYDYLPCLNDRPASIDMLASLIEQELHGWL